MAWKFEYGMELTWVGKAADVFRKGEEAIKAAFPIADDFVPPPPPIEEIIPIVIPEDATPEQREEIVEEAVNTRASETLDRMIGLGVDGIKQRFMRAGLGEEYAKKEATRLAKEFVLFDMGIITHIDPYKSGNVEKSSNTAWKRQEMILEAVPPQVRSPRRRIGRGQDAYNEAQASPVRVTSPLPSSGAVEWLNYRILTCLKEKWEPVGYRDKIGMPGIQWNGEREIEITSNVHRTIEQAEVFYRTATAGFEALGIKMETGKDAGGGGHLHVTYNKRGGGLRKDTMFNLVWDTIARPYICWAFNDPNDATTSRAPIDQMNNIMAGGTFNFAKGASVRWAQPAHRLSKPSFDDEGAAVDFTTEFRLFQMPKTWEEQKAHIEFVEAWAGAAEDKRYIEGIEPIRPFKGGKAKAFKSAEDCLQLLGEFMVNRLGLDYDVYRPIIEPNLVTKFAHYGHELT